MTAYVHGHNYQSLRLDSWYRNTHGEVKTTFIQKLMILSLMALNISMAFAVGMVIGWFAILHPYTTPDIKMFALVALIGGHAIASSFSLDMLPVLRNRRFIAVRHFVSLSVLLSLGSLMSGIYVMRLVRW